MSRELPRATDAIERVEEPVVGADGSGDHVMALHVDPRGDGTCGAVRRIVSRTGDVRIPGYVDRSRLHAVTLESPGEARMGPELDIRGTDDVVASLADGAADHFLGLEDPHLWWSRDAETLHLYCTIPFVDPDAGDYRVYLGHAEGEGLSSLTMTDPVLGPVPGTHGGAKEVAIPPTEPDGTRYLLVESNDTIDDTTYSVLRTAVAPDLSGPWEYDDLAFHPAHDGYEWCAGHVSPGPFLPREFVDVGEDRLVGLLNGRETTRLVDGDVRFGTFSIGLMIYDHERGTVEWVSEAPLLRDPAADTITFASAFRQTGANRGVIYAHVDDSSVRAYLVDADALSSHLP